MRGLPTKNNFSKIHFSEFIDTFIYIIIKDLLFQIMNPDYYLAELVTVMPLVMAHYCLCIAACVLNQFMSFVNQINLTICHI